MDKLIAQAHIEAIELASITLPDKHNGSQYRLACQKAEQLIKTLGVFWTKERDHELIALHDLGLKPNQIAQAWNISPIVVERRLIDLLDIF